MKPAEAYILKQDEPYQAILLDLKVMVESLIPEVKLEYKWRIPFFYIDKRPLFYLNQSKDYVDFCFWHSHLVSQHEGHFISTNRKLVKSLRYKSQQDINESVLIDVITAIRDSDFNPFKRNN